MRGRRYKQDVSGGKIVIGDKQQSRDAAPNCDTDDELWMHWKARCQCQGVLRDPSVTARGTVYERHYVCVREAPLWHCRCERQAPATKELTTLSLLTPRASYYEGNPMPHTPTSFMGRVHSNSPCSFASVVEDKAFNSLILGVPRAPRLLVNNNVRPLPRFFWWIWHIVLRPT